MAIDFPSSPTEGQVYNAVPGTSFVYRSGEWQRAPMKTALPKNYLVNPAMQISQQRGATSTALSPGIYMVDQWRWIASATPAGGATQNAAVTPYGSLNRLRLSVVDTGLLAGRMCYVSQPIEGTRVADLQFGTSAAVQVVVRVGIRCVGIINGKCSLSIRNAANNRIYYASQLSITTADTYFTVVFPGDVTGTWIKDNTGIGLDLRIGLGSGSTNWGTPNTWVTSGEGLQGDNLWNSDTYFPQIFDCGLYADPWKTGVAPPWEPPDFIEELRRCQRYWYRGMGFRGFVTAATTCGRLGGQHPVIMRDKPVGTIVGAPKIYDASGTPTISALGGNVCNTYAFEYDVTCAAGGMVGGRAGVQYYLTDNDYIAVSARM